MSVAVVTDSTAYLPSELASRLTIVPLTVVVDGQQGREGVEVGPAEVARALVARPVAVTTSRPAPSEFIRVYRRLLDDGASGVLSVHISARLSGTLTAATLAAAEFPGLVDVVDSHSAGMGLGFPVLAALAAADAGGDLPLVRQATMTAVARTTTLFYVDTLEYLRRGGRIGAASSLLGTALAVKPILRTSERGVVVLDKVRTASRALARMVDLAVEDAGDRLVDVAVHHLAAPERAASVVEAVAHRLGGALHHRYLTEVGAAVAAHVGPGTVCVVVHRAG